MTRLVLLGGFLGAGKTTSLLRLARFLVTRGERVGVLTNDQGHDLIDTEIFKVWGMDTRGVEGGCFCCRLEDFLEEANSLITSSAPTFLLAEPVGSCTDLSATVIRPLQKLYPEKFDVAPFAVLIDPLRARDALSKSGRASLSEKVTYIYRLQQMEANVIAVNKCDLLRPEERTEIRELISEQFPGIRAVLFSARTGEGFEELLDLWMGPGTGGDQPSPEIDYGLYAEGEAELAWFDGRFLVTSARPVEMDSALEGLGRTLGMRLREEGLLVAHVKLLLRAGKDVALVNLARTDAIPEFSREAKAEAVRMELWVNARVGAHPEVLAGIVKRGVGDWSQGLALALEEISSAAFSPQAPVPFRRIE